MKTLDQLKVGDYVMTESGSALRGKRKMQNFTKITGIDEKGFIYLHGAKPERANWRSGYNPKTGTRSGDKFYGIAVPDEMMLAKFLRDQMQMDDRKRKELERQGRQDYQDANRLSNMDTDAWLKALTPEELRALVSRLDRVAEPPENCPTCRAPMLNPQYGCLACGWRYEPKA